MSRHVLDPNFGIVSTGKAMSSQATQDFLNKPPTEQNQFNQSPKITPLNLLTQLNIASFDGTQINSAYPIARLMTTVAFDVDIGLVGIYLSSSIVNVSTSVASVLVMQNQGTLLNFTNASQAYLAHLSYTNSAPFNPFPTSRSSGFGLGGDLAIKISAGTSLAIYMSAANDANNVLSGVVTYLYYNL